MCVCVCACLQWWCLSRRLHSLIGLICAIGGRPLAMNCWPQSLSLWATLVFGDELQLLAQLEVSSRSSFTSFNLTLTHSPIRPSYFHTLSSDCKHFPAKKTSISPHWQLPDSPRERGQWLKRILWILNCSPALFSKGIFLIIIVLWLCSTNLTQLSVWIGVCHTTSVCVHVQTSCLRCPFLEFMVAVMVLASVFYEAAGGVGLQAFWHCV